MAGQLKRLFIPGVGESFIQENGGTPYEADTVQKYPLGTIMTLGLRKFAYAKAGGTLNCDLGAKQASHQHMAYTTIAADAAAGDTSIVADFGATDGAAHNGAVGEDELVGGFIVVFPHSSNTFVRQIIGNTAVAGSGGEITITLDSPIPCALVTDSDHCEAMASPFLNVKTDNDGGVNPVVGIPTVPATEGQFCWLLVSGPGWAAPQAEVGDAAQDLAVTFRHDGSLDEHDYSDAYNTKQQHAGFVLSKAYGGTQGAPFINFQIFS